MTQEGQAMLGEDGNHSSAPLKSQNVPKIRDKVRGGHQAPLLELLVQDRARGRNSMEAPWNWDRKVQAAPKGTWGGTVPLVWPCCSLFHQDTPPSLKIQEAPPQHTSSGLLVSLV